MPDKDETKTIDIKISDILITKETENEIKTRVPKTYGDKERYLILNQDDIEEINNGKTLLATLEKDEIYNLIDKAGNVIEPLNGEQLANKYYDPVPQKKKTVAEETVFNEEDETKTDKENTSQQSQDKKDSEQNIKLSHSVLDSKHAKFEIKKAKLEDKNSKLQEKIKKAETKIEKWQAKKDDSVEALKQCRKLLDIPALPAPVVQFLKLYEQSKANKISSLEDKLTNKKQSITSKQNKIEKNNLRISKISKKLTKQKTGGDDFWEKAERLLYSAYIALIITMCPEDEWNFQTLIEFINSSECHEEDEGFMNAIDYAFYYLEKWIENLWYEDEEFDEETENYRELQNDIPTAEQISLGKFAVRQYKAYKLAAGKTAKSILISCSTRLAPFAIDSVLEITQYDEMHLDKIGDELTALFIIISDTDETFNFLVAIMYSQMFNLLCTKADNNPDGSGKLKYHVRCLLDEFANIGEIPNFDKLIATIRSREISVSIILQTKSQLKARYKDNAETIEGNCDTTLFLGGKERTTLKEISEALGKETIDMFNTSRTRGNQESYGMNYQKLGRDLMSPDELQVMDNTQCILQIRGLRPFFSKKFEIEKHSRYSMLFDFDKKNYFDVAKFVAEQQKHRTKLTNDTIIDEHIIRN